ncbi:MAG: nicotinate (nicotinamide) nucleotide adenylyltransferase [Phycisphaerae bacterium]|jgi:nicotinate-nucleotide adenylyltransferase
MALKRVLLFGGSFDPVHTGHVELLKEVQGKLKFDKVIILPALSSPFKQDSLNAGPQERLDMLKLAFAGIEHCEVSDMEFNMPSPSYTINTLERLSAEQPGWRLHWLCGWDVVEDLHKWYRIEDILRLVTFVVMGRSGNKPPLAGKVMELAPDIIEVETKLYDISSTFIRAELEAGRTPDGLPGPLLSYIREKGLYGCTAS